MVTWGRIISLSISLIYLLLAYIFRGGELTLKMLIYLIFVLACIWFGEELGSYTGFSWIGNMYISEESPGSVITCLGWILLILPTIIWISFRI